MQKDMLSMQSRRAAVEAVQAVNSLEQKGIQRAVSMKATEATAQHHAYGE